MQARARHTRVEGLKTLGMMLSIANAPTESVVSHNLIPTLVEYLASSDDLQIEASWLVPHSARLHVSHFVTGV
jgi:hypothetical protein